MEMTGGQALARQLVAEGVRDVFGIPVLQQLVAPCERGAVLFIGTLPADETLFLATVRAGLKLEGMMAKRKMSPYRPGVRSEDWLKIKRPGWQEGRTWRK